MNERVIIMNEWFTVTQAAKETGVPSETVRRYTRQYGDYLQIKRGAKRSYLIHESSLDVIRKIRNLLEDGNQREQVMDILQQTEAINVQTDDEEMNEYLMNLPQMQRETFKQMNEMSEQIDKQNELIEKLSNKLDEQQMYIDKRLEERDQSLMQSINESLETQKQLAASEQKKKGFFARLFGKEDKND